MPRLLCCRLCRVEMTRIELADRSVAILCLGCDSIGVEDEVARGGPVWRADAVRPARPIRGRAGEPG